MSSFSKDFEINFSSLKAGVHEFKYVINDAFFDQTELERDFKNSDIHFDVRLEKSESMMTFYFDLDGEVEMPCGRCTEYMEVKFEGDYKQVVKFGEETGDLDDLMVLAPKEYKINLGSLLYEFSILTMPDNTLHEDKKDCNQEYLESISEYLLTEIEEDEEIEEEKEIDPRWSQLKNLKNKNN